MAWHPSSRDHLWRDSIAPVGIVCLPLAGYAALALTMSGRAGVALDDAGLVTAFGIGMAACLLRGRSMQGRERMMWMLFASCLAFNVIGFMVQGWYELVGNIVPAPRPSLQDAFHGLSMPLAIAGVTKMPSRGPRQPLVRELLDGAVIALGFLAVAWELLIRDGLSEAGRHNAPSVAAVAYPPLVVLIATFLWMLVSRTDRTNRLIRVFALALLGAVTSETATLLWLVRFGGRTPAILDVGFLMAILTVATAAWMANPSTDRRLGHAGTPGLSKLALPYMPAIVAMGLAVKDQFVTHDLDSPMFACLMALVAAVMIRQLALVADNVHLLHDLEVRRVDLAYRVHHDPLTGLANRVLFFQELQADVTGQRPSGVLYVDLDDFKEVNDRLGHEVGDALLTHVGHQIAGSVREGDVVARLGGDEFAVLLRSISGPEDVARLAERLSAAIATPLPVGGSAIRVQASIGVAPSRGLDADTTLRRADIAMYEAKRGGRGLVRVFEDGMGHGQEPMHTRAPRPTSGDAKSTVNRRPLSNTMGADARSVQAGNQP